MHKGFFTAENLDLELNFGQSGAAVTQQLTGGSLDVALSVGITDPIRAIQKGAPLALIRVVGDAAPYVLIGKPDIKSIAELKGKTISTGADNDITTVYFERMMAANGVKKGEYTTLPAGVAASRFAALKAGVVDAAVVLPPLNFQAAAAGFSILGYAADFVKDLPFTGMAVQRRWATANMSAAKRVLTATDKSVAWLADPAHRDEAIELLVKVGRSSKENAEASYDYMRRISYFEPSSTISRKKLQNLVETEQRSGTIPAGFDIERLAMPGLTELTD
jgi:ABC-type nitrate/sulfonate/bicarbonate transport system substrate-binding protein